MLFSCFSPALAQNQAEQTQESNELPSPGITPDSFWYFAEILKERVMLIFTFNKGAKIEKYLTLARERIAESRVMLERNKKREAITAMDEYISLLKRAEYTSRVAQEKDLAEIKDESIQSLREQNNHFKELIKTTNDKIVTPKITESRRWIGQLRNGLSK